MPPAGFEPTISVGERPQTYALDSAATGTKEPLINTKFMVTLFVRYQKILYNGMYKSAGCTLVYAPCYPQNSDVVNLGLGKWGLP